jgi:hypothetical protein
MDLTGVRGHGGIDSFHELKELVVAVPAVTLADYLASGDIQCREQRRRAVPFVIVGSLFWQPGSHRQDGLRPVQRLHL